MELQDYVDKIKFQLTGGVIECELDDKSLEKIVIMSMDEMNRYYNVSSFIQVDASSCINMVNYPQVESVIGVHRVSGLNTANNISDPTYVSQLQLYNISNSYTNTD